LRLVGWSRTAELEGVPGLQRLHTAVSYFPHGISSISELPALRFRVVELNCLMQYLRFAMSLSTNYESEEEIRRIAEGFGSVTVLDKMKLHDELIPAILHAGN
jgi:hypothetical protein